MKLIRAIIELLEAKAENIREDTSTIQLGVYARGYKDGQDDLMERVEVVYVSGDDDEDD